MPAIKSVKLESVQVVHETDTSPAMTDEETGNPDSPEQDYQRCEDYNRCGWHMIGVYAVARITIGGVAQEIRSAGLWGVESDSGDYLPEVADEELAQLRGLLADVGIELEDSEWETMAKGAADNVKCR